MKLQVTNDISRMKLAELVVPNLLSNIAVWNTESNQGYECFTMENYQLIWQSDLNDVEIENTLFNV